jgi:hypothetical protein
MQGSPSSYRTVPSALKAAAKYPVSSLFQEAMMGPNCEEFLEAMRMEISELESQNCWDVIAVNNVPEGKKVLPTMWFFKIKRVCHFKARLVVRDNFQVEGIDYDEKYAPVVHWSTVRFLLSIAASQGLGAQQFAFSETVFVPIGRGNVVQLIVSTMVRVMVMDSIASCPSPTKCVTLMH